MNILEWLDPKMENNTYYYEPSKKRNIRHCHGWLANYSKGQFVLMENNYVYEIISVIDEPNKLGGIDRILHLEIRF